MLSNVMQTGQSVPLDEVRPDAVVIMGTLWQSGVPHLVAIREYRVPLGAYEYSLPAGLVDGQEHVISAAERELREETGLALVGECTVSPVVFSSAGLTDESVQYVFGLCEGTPTNKNAEESEDIEIVLLTEEKVKLLLEGKEQFKNSYISAKAWPLMAMWLLGEQISDTLHFGRMPFSNQSEKQ
jgi:ADP-ribose pyrophosphatase